MLNVAVVGCGWLGLPLAVSLKKKNYSVIGTTTSRNKIPSLKELGISAFILDLSEPLQKKDVLFLDQLDLVIINIPPSKLKGDFSYSEALLHFVALIKSKIKIIFVSTTGVYPDSIRIAEESYVFNEEDLEKETVRAEFKLKQFLKNRLTIIRLAGLIGLNRHPINY